VPALKSLADRINKRLDITEEKSSELEDIALDAM
jgi:hypothetical protein